MILDYFILGDSAYPCLEHLLTPYKDNGHLNNAQKNYNITLSSCRVIIEHAFGVLKQRFRQLYYCKLRGVKKLCHFIRACCVLHNFIIEERSDENIELSEEEVENVVCDEEATLEAGKDTTAGKIKRNEICDQLKNSM